MATDDERSGGWYTHTDADEANLLKAKIKSAICSHKNEDDLYEAYEGSTFDKFTGEETADKQVLGGVPGPLLAVPRGLGEVPGPP